LGLVYITNPIKNFRLNVCDNTKIGGIPEDHLNKIFKANFTTKKENGSGIGLYMSSLIAQKNQIELNVKNIDNGSMFILKK
jgi:signal transduction histidine kinase